MIIEGIHGVKLAKIAVIGLKRKSMKHYSWQTGGQVKLCFCISIFWKLLLALFCFLLLTYKRYLINSDSFSIAILNCSERKFSCYTILISIFMMFFFTKCLHNSTCSSHSFYCDPLLFSWWFFFSSFPSIHIFSVCIFRISWWWEKEEDGYIGV